MNNAATIYYASKIFNEKLKEADKRNFAETEVNLSSTQQAVVEPEGKSSGKSIVFNVGPLKVILEKQPRIVNNKAQEVIKNQGALNMTSEEKAAVTGKEASAAKQEVAAAVNGKPTIKGWQLGLRQVFNGLTRGSAGKERTKTARFKFESLVIPFFAKTDEIQNSNSFSNLVGKSIADGFGQIPTTGAQDSVALEKLGVYKGLDNLGAAIMKVKPENAKIYNTAFKQLMNKGYWLAIYANQKRKIDNPERHEKLYAIWSSRERQAAMWVKNTKIFLKAVIDGVKPVLEGYPKLTNEEEKQWKEGTAKGAEPSTGAQSSAGASTSSSSAPTGFVGEYFASKTFEEALKEVAKVELAKPVNPEAVKQVVESHFKQVQGFTDKALAPVKAAENEAAVKADPASFDGKNDKKNFAILIKVFKELETADKSLAVTSENYRIAHDTVAAISKLTLQDWQPEIKNLALPNNKLTDLVKNEAGNELRDNTARYVVLETSNATTPDQLDNYPNIWKIMKENRKNLYFKPYYVEENLRGRKQEVRRFSLNIPSKTVPALLYIMDACLACFDT